MSEQQSQKQGLKSAAQKEDRARDAYASVPPSNPVGGAFGNPTSGEHTDQDLALSLEEKRARQDREG
jgi:hypothetical protein